MTVEQLLANLSSAELTEWVAYLQLEYEREQGGDEPPEMSEEEAWRKAFNCNG